jgi:hypothetical protein
MSIGSGDYEIGYGKPPKEYRWPKGHCGNPSSRKKASGEFGEAFRRVAHKKIQLIENGKSRTTSMIDAVMRAPLINALKKNKQNMLYVLSLMEEFGTEIYALPNRKLDRVYRNYEGKPVITVRLLPKRFETLIAEFERKNPAATKAWLRALGEMLERQRRGQV